jgi:hypothetical protein
MFVDRVDHLQAIYEQLDEFDFSTDEPVATGRP